MEILKNPVVEYYHMKRETQLTYRRYFSTNCKCCPLTTDITTTFQEKEPLEELLTSAERDGNAEAAVEAALRIWTSGASTDRIICVLWKMFDTETCPRQVSRTTHTHGLSFMASMYLEAYRAFKGTEMGDYVLRFAQQFANRSARFGLISKAVLDVGAATVVAADRRGFVAYPHLRAAYGDYLKHLARKGHPELESFACSAECGIYSSKLTGLRRCMGACPSAHKAYYCTKECQKIDWPRHKLVCRADATEDDAAALPPSLYTQEKDLELRRAAGSLLPEPHSGVLGRFREEGYVPGSDGSHNWKTVYTIDMGERTPPGRDRLVTSSDVPPAMLKHMRYQLDPDRACADTSEQWVTDECGRSWLRTRDWV